jgi:predicted short-subunit dehydrogenase-like oxidoreductase (DUF2520 family)
VDVVIVGAGRVGTALAVLLLRAGRRIAAVSGREATRQRAARFLPDVPVLPPAQAAARGDLVLIATPDDAIAAVCGEIAAAVGEGRWVGHLSGATGLEALDAARRAGAGVLCVHPLQTFPDVEAAVDRIPGSTVAVTAEEEEGYALGELLARDVGARPIRLPDGAKPLYHAAAVFASNYLVATQALAEELFGLAGVADPLRAFLPLSRATLENVAAMGPGRALTGPAVRGDAGTVERNLAALAAAAPHAIPAYVAMARVALDLAVRAGRLDAEGRAGVERVLARWQERGGA